MSVLTAQIVVTAVIAVTVVVAAINQSINLSFNRA